MSMLVVKSGNGVAYLKTNTGFTGRGWAAGLVFFLAFAVVAARLSHIQLMTSKQAALIARAQEQQSREYVVDSGRGMILDRHGDPIVGERGKRLIAFPMDWRQVRLHAAKLKRVAEIAGYSYDALIQKLIALKKPQSLPTSEGDDWIVTPDQAREIEALHIPGIHVMETDNRSAPYGLARQLIGRVERDPFLLRERYGEELASGTYQPLSRIGVSGLEASFEPFLRSQSENVITYAVDGRGRPLNGLRLKQLPGREGTDAVSYQVVTTLDRRMQHAVEKILHDEGVADGAVVLQEISTGDVLAMASRPLPDGGSFQARPWDNRAVMETVPGSIFKTVVAVAALDTGIVKPDTVFVCRGELGRYGLRDAKPGGHGKLTFTQAFAHSCNIVFAQLAERLGGETIEKYARKLGLAQKVSWNGSLFHESDFRQLLEEQTGLIFSSKAARRDRGAVAQTGIGQRDVRLTPLQAANLVTSLFHDGQSLTPRLVLRVQSPDGQAVAVFRPQAYKENFRIKPKTLVQVRRMMRAAVMEGTAVAVQAAKWELAGKTGTAQVGTKKDRYNKWMIGYGPYNRPRYAVSVVLRGVPDSQDPRALRIFQRVMDEVALIEAEERDDGKRK
ncbi:penicillin-binding protein 2 [Polycladomyces subterraneus]|uniref:Penicillin-binding protein 2 n=1 Tax=Polycladomyces subterraneus TaxID=1016997 RepID=A0ABT8IKL6_9BACL|nr:penicillin-binding protein 2 [Polycladomyces subterraneus]